MGSRLKPLSTIEKPKPFLKLFSDKTMLQETLLRVKGTKNPTILCSSNHTHLVLENLGELNISADIIIEEPVSRNTAPAIALAAKYYCRKKPDEVLLFLPCDHMIQDLEAFHEAITEAITYCNEGHFVLFGEKATVPDSDYGYIQSETTSRFGFVKKFHEKPDVELAAEYVNLEYLWNTGIIMAQAGTIFNAFEIYSNDLYQKIIKINPERVSKTLYENIPNISMDYKVLEKMSDLSVLKVSMQWTDIGTMDRLKALA